MSHANALSATLEVDGREYPIANLRIEGEGNQRIYSLAGQIWLAGQPGATATAYVIGNAAHRLWGKSLGATCRLVISGESFTARVLSLSCDYDPPPSVLEIKLDSMKPIPVKDASPPADSVPEQEIAWSELRSACHRKAWREAWEIVGTDHTGDATPGEVYIFGVAREVRAVTAALKAWREAALPAQALMLRQAETASDVETIRVRRMMARKIGEDAGWQRIKQVVAWESQAAAQHDPEHRRRHERAAARRAIRRGGSDVHGGD